jgi:hypothetical protein
MFNNHEGELSSKEGRAWASEGHLGSIITFHDRQCHREGNKNLGLRRREDLLALPRAVDCRNGHSTYTSYSISGQVSATPKMQQCKRERCLTLRQSGLTTPLPYAASTSHSRQQLLPFRHCDAHGGG